MLKTCIICKIALESSFFYKDKTRNDGFSNKCKNCERLKCREKRLNNKETFVRKEKKYYQKNKEKVLSKRKTWYKNNKHKVLAHEKVKRALYKGILFRQPCEVCAEIKTDAHHRDYTKPLDVTWLCHKCHMIEHWGK